MPDPEDLLAAEAAGEAVPGVTLPGESILAPPVGPKNVAIDFLGRMWGKLTAPTAKKPEDYRGRILADLVNVTLDKGATGPSSDNLFGESVDLAVEHLVAGEGGGNTPLGYLTVSSYGMLSDRRQAAKAKLGEGKS